MGEDDRYRNHLALNIRAGCVAVERHLSHDLQIILEARGVDREVRQEVRRFLTTTVGEAISYIREAATDLSMETVAPDVDLEPEM